jgi:hypothetical protein
MSFFINLVQFEHLKMMDSKIEDEMNMQKVTDFETSSAVSTSGHLSTASDESSMRGKKTARFSEEEVVEITLDVRDDTVEIQVILK